MSESAKVATVAVRYCGLSRVLTCEERTDIVACTPGTSVAQQLLFRGNFLRCLVVLYRIYKQVSKTNMSRTLRG